MNSKSSRPALPVCIVGAYCIIDVQAVEVLTCTYIL